MKNLRHASLDLYLIKTCLKVQSFICSKNVCEKTIFCFSLLLFQRIFNAFLYDLYHEIGDILTCPCHYRYIYNNTNTTRVIKSMEVFLSTHRDPLSILNTFTVGQEKTNLAWGRPTTDSSTSSDLLPDLAVDGFTYDSIHSETGPKHHTCMTTDIRIDSYWQVDLGTTHTVIYLEVTPIGTEVGEQIYCSRTEAPP